MIDCDLILQRPVKVGVGGNVRPRPNINEPPSILEQTKWPVGFFDFSKSKLPVQPGVDYFNCALLERPDGDFLIVRRSRNHPGMPWGINDLVAFELHGIEPREGIPIKISAQHQGEHFEDPRSIWHDGRAWISCTNFVWGQKWTGAHQILAEVGSDWKSTARHDPVYGNNGAHVWANRGFEKNWLWFFHDGKPHLLYLSQPMVILEWSEDFKRYREHISRKTQQAGLWHFGQIRGGSPPIRIGEEYWTFFHSSMADACAGNRRYFLGAMAFEAKPPFNITKITGRPLLRGSAADRFSPHKPLTVFCCGAIHRRGKWLLSAGINDLDSAWAVIPHDELEKEMREIK